MKTSSRSSSYHSPALTVDRTPEGMTLCARRTCVLAATLALPLTPNNISMEKIKGVTERSREAEAGREGKAPTPALCRTLFTDSASVEWRATVSVCRLCATQRCFSVYNHKRTCASRSLKWRGIVGKATYTFSRQVKNKTNKQTKHWFCLDNALKSECMAFNCAFRSFVCFTYPLLANRHISIYF